MNLAQTHNSLSPNSAVYNPELPDTATVMASLLHVTTTYMNRPSLELAKLALHLSETLLAPEYAETDLICQTSRRMCIHWTRLINKHQHSSN